MTNGVEGVFISSSACIGDCCVAAVTALLCPALTRRSRCKGRSRRSEKLETSPGRKGLGYRGVGVRMIGMGGGGGGRGIAREQRLTSAETSQAIAEGRGKEGGEEKGQEGVPFKDCCYIGEVYNLVLDVLQNPSALSHVG